MIVLDTNVVSELMRGARVAAEVAAWAADPGEQPVTTVFNRAELLAGIALLPPGERRRRLDAGVRAVLADLQICLPFSEPAGAAYAEVVAARTAMGRPIATMDALIASVAHVHDAAVATRDIDGFDGLGLRLVDPFSAQ